MTKNICCRYGQKEDRGDALRFVEEYHQPGTEMLVSLGTPFVIADNPELYLVLRLTGHNEYVQGFPWLGAWWGGVGRQSSAPPLDVYVAGAEETVQILSSTLYHAGKLFLFRCRGNWGKKFCR